MQQLIGLAFLRNNTNILCNGFVVFVSYLHLYVYEIAALMRATSYNAVGVASGDP
jgi:hypothetical protein